VNALVLPLLLLLDLALARQTPASYLLTSDFRAYFPIADAVRTGR